MVEECKSGNVFKLNKLLLYNKTDSFLSPAAYYGSGERIPVDQLFGMFDENGNTLLINCCLEGHAGCLELLVM